EPDGPLDECLVLEAGGAAARPGVNRVSALPHRLVDGRVLAPVGDAGDRSVRLAPIEHDVARGRARGALPERDGQVAVQRRVLAGHDTEVAGHAALNSIPRPRTSRASTPRSPEGDRRGGLRAPGWPRRAGGALRGDAGGSPPPRRAG